MGWQRGLEVWGWVGAGPSEAHVERSAGKGATAAVSLFLAHWFLWGQGAIFYQAPACHKTVPAVSSWASGGQFDGLNPGALK